MDAAEPNERRDFYVYALFRPNGHICYIGKGSKRRWRSHDCHKATSRYPKANPHLARIIVKAGGEIPKVKLRENLTEKEAFALERTLIRAIGREKFGGPLVNLTEGGEGASGFVLSPEHRAKILASQLGRKATPEQRARMSAAHKGQKLSPEHIEKIASKKRGRKLSPEHCAKIGDAHRGVRHTPEAIAKMRLAHANMSLETRARMSAAQLGKRRGPLSDETRRKIAESNRQTWALKNASIGAQHAG